LYHEKNSDFYFFDNFHLCIKSNVIVLISRETENMDIRFNYSGNSMNNMYFCNIFTFPVPQVYYLPPQVNPNPQNMFYTPMQFLENVPSYPFSASK